MMDDRVNNQSSGNVTDDKKQLLPSEVARAVCGYLTSVGCHSSRATFVEEHPELNDFNALVQKGLIRSVDTDIDGMSLYDIVNEYVM